jgi:micrococcal nuclease
LLPTITPTTSAPTSSEALTTTPTTIAPLPTTPATTPASTASQQVSLEVKVIKVLDGDTIEVEINGVPTRVRYIGMDTPEVSPEAESFAKEASDFNRSLVEGKTVRLEKDVSEVDKYGRLLRYVYAGDVFVNAELVRVGLATAWPYPPDTKYQQILERAEVEAKNAKRGLWVPLSLQITSVTSPVNLGASATLNAKTYPGANCSIIVNYKSGPSSASGLDPKKADISGNVSWTWKVSTNTASGSWNIEVNATLDEQTATQKTPFTVR